MERQIIATFDDEGIIVYQAFKPSIANEALRNRAFGKGFKLNRMTWIKPSFGWILYRSKYASKHRQESILKIKITHEGFQTIIAKGVPTSFEPSLFNSEEDWRRELQRSEVRYQWDPDRDLRLRRLNSRALQLGIRGSMIRNYANKWILEIEDVTELAHNIKTAIEQDHKKLPTVPSERVYEVSIDIQRNLRMI